MGEKKERDQNKVGGTERMKGGGCQEEEYMMVTSGKHTHTHRRKLITHMYTVLRQKRREHVSASGASV